MNAWGVLVTGVGFLLLYLGIKNKNVSDLVNTFRPQATPNTSTKPAPTPQSNAPSGTTGLAPQNPNGGGIAGLFGGTNVPPGSLGNAGGLA